MLGSLLCYMFSSLFWSKVEYQTDSMKENNELTKPALPKNHTKIYLTNKELYNYRGLNDKPVYLAIKNNIFDVSSKCKQFSIWLYSIEIYRERQNYHVFAGHDISTNLAK